MQMQMQMQMQSEMFAVRQLNLQNQLPMVEAMMILWP